MSDNDDICGRAARLRALLLVWHMQESRCAPLRSVSSTVLGREPVATTYTPKFTATIDYAFVSEQVELTGARSFPSVAPSELPALDRPSDHIWLAGSARLFALKGGAKSADVVESMFLSFLANKGMRAKQPSSSQSIVR